MSRTAWPGSRTQAPSSAISPACARPCRNARKPGAGRRGSSCRRSRSSADAGQIRIVGVKCLQSRQQARLRLSHALADIASDGTGGLQLDSAATLAAMPRASLGRKRAVARESRQVDIERRRVEQRRQAPAGSASACAASCASRSGVRRLRAGARRSRNLPPPIVRWAVVSRSTKRSPAAAAIGPIEHELNQRLRRRARSAHRRAARCAHRPRPPHDAAAPASSGRPAWSRSAAARSVASIRVGRRMQRGIEHHVAARDRVLADAVAGEIERAAVASLPALRRRGSARGSSERAPSVRTG